MIGDYNPAFIPAMLFNSFHFLVFFAIVCPAYWLLPYRLQRYLLLGASYYFYMSWKAHYAALLAFSTLVDYLVARGMARHDDRPRWRLVLLLTSLTTNLGLLFAFKYWGFFGESFEAVSRLLGRPMEWPSLEVLLPVGISFYTFQALSYTIDVYRRRIPAQRSLPIFALYVSFFPQLVAGPIERASHLIPQLLAPRTFEMERALHGLKLVLAGLFKKMVVADNLAPFVERIYGGGGHGEPVVYLLATYAFAFQIYADFSGYSDIAVGVAKLMGFDFISNFETPYFSRGVTEFWHRWHISLSTWLRDYLYIPLGGNRIGVGRTYVNLGLTMLLGGLWHGAHWNFVIWGALNGLYLAAARLWAGRAAGLAARLRIPDAAIATLQRLLTFHSICLTWVFFRSQSLDGSMGMVTALARSVASGDLFSRASAGRALEVLGNQGATPWLVLALLLWDLWFGSGHGLERFQRTPMLLRYAAYSALALSILGFGVYRQLRFIYFQF
jgi:D-alanyl-lipoteichoic acid acyltransferase DltB (MBOAT superfamily)